MKWYVYPDYEVYDHPVTWKSDDFVVVEADDEETALAIYLEMERQR